MKDVQLDSDLWWYWNDAVGNMGLHAAPLEPSTGPDHNSDVDGKRLAAAGWHRVIETVLGGLTEDQVRLLALVHRPVPPAMRPHFAPLGNLTHPVVDEKGPEWALERLHAGNETELTPVLADIRKRVHKALKDFRAELSSWTMAIGVKRPRL